MPDDPLMGLMRSGNAQENMATKETPPHARAWFSKAHVHKGGAQRIESEARQRAQVFGRAKDLQGESLAIAHHRVT
jgi:hypothetical protein